MNTFEFPAGTVTLRQRLNDGPMPVQDGLRYAAQLAVSLRAIHERGGVHGSVTPEAMMLTDSGLELLPPTESASKITPYTAPEVASEHQTADVRSDIFSFGAVIFEIITGRPAFEGDSEIVLIDSLCAALVPSSGFPGVDRLVAACVAKDPDERWQHMQKVQLELKLLVAATRRAGTPAVASPQAVSETAVRAEMAELEARIMARLATQEQATAEMQIAVNDAITSVRGQLSAISLRVSNAQAAFGHGGESLAGMESMAIRLAGDIRAELQESIDHLSRRIAYVEQGGIGSGSPSDEIARIDLTLDRMRKELHDLHQNMALDFQEFENNLKAQSAAIESGRTAMAQTDELVERVVEALDALQASVTRDERLVAAS